MQKLLKYADRDDIRTVFESSPQFIAKLEEDLAGLDRNDHAAVLSAQVRLQALGLYDKALDGDFGRNTNLALNKFLENVHGGTTYASTLSEPGILARLHAPAIEVTGAPSYIISGELPVLNTTPALVPQV